jgi:hypothetical protein
MKMKNLLLTIAVTFVLTELTMAQNVPNYVPTNGLVGWWPFNGNANDESGNANNGTIQNGVLSTNDRYSNQNSAYDFDGTNDQIEVSNSISISPSQYVSVNTWIYPRAYEDNKHCVSKGSHINLTYRSFGILGPESNNKARFFVSNGSIEQGISTLTTLTLNQWYQITGVYDGSTLKIYVNGVLDNQLNFTGLINQNSEPLLFGSHKYYSFSDYWFNGKIDDIGIWNRALTQQEITDLYNAVNCANNTTITPQSNSLLIGSTATFAASTSDPNPSYFWQSDFGQGFQTLYNIGNYSGSNTATLNIANVQLSEHNQPFRVITTSGNCIDTSNVAIISIADTCINTITDTTLITVTDTLLINTTITSLNPPNNANTIKVFPNPTNDHITINYGNFSVMNGYQLKIENSLGQQVFQTNITQQSDYLNLTTWGGNGLYFVHIIDPQGNTIDIRKIVLQ